MILCELLTAMTHVASQLTGIWFPAPHAGITGQDEGLLSGAIKQYEEGGLAKVTRDAWVELLENDLSSFNPRLIWLERLLRSRRICLSVLANAAARHFEEVSAATAELISIHSPLYPPLLRQITRPPLYLTAMGNVRLLRSPSLAVIGSRRASYESLRASVELGLLLAKSPWTVVSGGAIGCDIAVHEGMLASENDNIAAVVVFAGGLHARFPRCNDRVFCDVLERGGVLISERLWFQDVVPRDFPARNRIVSGMCLATAVMSAAPRSGSLITAQEALEQGRDIYVFDVLGDDARMDGSRNLILEGACSFFTPGELLEYLTQGNQVVFNPSLGDPDITCQEANYLGTFEAEQILN